MYKKSLKIVIVLLVWIGSYLVPKKKDFYIFIPGHEKNKFSGNLKYFYLYVNNLRSVVNCLWLTTDNRVFKELKMQSLPVKKYIYFPLWSFLRADKIFLDSSIWFLPFGKFKVIQLWHGTGYKNIGAMNAKNKINYKSLLMKSHLDKNKLILATSESDCARKSQSFLSDKCVVVGSPRNDVFFDPSFQRNKYKKNISIGGFDFVFLYAPTFRDAENIDRFSDNFWAKLNEFLIKTNAAFVIKKHPSDKGFRIPSSYSHIVDVSNLVEDFQKLLAVTDVLITDYSGVASDYALTSKPIIFHVFDFEKYIKKERSLYYDLKKILPGPFSYNENDLLDLMFDLSWFKDENYEIKYNTFVSTFQYYRDGDSCKRLFKIVKNI